MLSKTVNNVMELFNISDLKEFPSKMREFFVFKVQIEATIVQLREIMSLGSNIQSVAVIIMINSR